MSEIKPDTSDDEPFNFGPPGPPAPPRSAKDAEHPLPGFFYGHILLVIPLMLVWLVLVVVSLIHGKRNLTTKERFWWSFGAITLVVTTLVIGLGVAVKIGGERSQKQYEASAEGQFNAAFGRATTNHRRRNYSEAISAYTQAIQVSPSTFSTVQAYYNRGIAYQEHEQYDAAVADYTKVLELDPTKSDVLKPIIEQLKEASRQRSEWLKALAEDKKQREESLKRLDEATKRLNESLEQKAPTEKK